MSPEPQFPKIIQVKFTGADENDPVTITNNRTGQVVNKDQSGDSLRLEATKQVVYDLNNLTEGYAIDDIITVSVGGANAGTTAITLTNAKTPQISTVTATAVSTAVINI